MKTAFTLAASLLVISAPIALANGNSGNAKAMTENIKTYGGGIAKTVSGNETRSNSGWGNIGSAATGSGALGGNFTAGGQVSKSGKPD